MLDSTVIGRDINIIINFFLQFLEIECFCRSLQFRLFKRRVAITRVKVRENGQQKNVPIFQVAEGYFTRHVRTVYRCTARDVSITPESPPVVSHY